MALSALVLTVSDSCSKGQEDLSGPVICDLLKDKNFNSVSQVIVPDDLEKIKVNY